MASSSAFERQTWPNRAVVTAGMPYGNKPLHFGHIAGVFVPADCYARFLRDRIGAANVRFVCGTDCFGSPIDEGYRKLVESGAFDGTIAEYVQRNHDAQAKTLASFDISLDIYEGSGLGHAGEVHQQLSEALIRRLHEKGWLTCEFGLQFYDSEAGIFLNGRQVVGRCPVQGCKSEHGYADECDLGHSYAPEDLIAPRSTVTGTTPDLREVENWYFNLPAFRGFLCDHLEGLKADPDIRPIVVQTCSEFLGAPIIYVKNEERGKFESLAGDLPEHTVHEPEKGKASFAVEFADIASRDEACRLMRREAIRLRTSKTLVPFRITGNIDWGVAAPAIDGVEGLTVWCWPESLWAPISFTIAASDERGLPEGSWRDFWCGEAGDGKAEIYQFIGQDNLYFYGVVQPALWEALGSGGVFGQDGPLRQTRLVANHHVLFGDKKASSSGAVKPPTADELLEHYTAGQLRAHFLALGLDQKSVGFKPKAFEPEAVRADSRVADPALKESKLLHNVFNRLARSVLYEAKRNFDTALPAGDPTPAVVARAHEALAAYDRTMKKAELHSIMSLMDEFIRYANKMWADGISAAEASGDANARRQTLVDAAYALWVCTLLMHPIVPAGCEDICAKLAFDPKAFFSWEHDFRSLSELDADGSHAVEELPPRYDFF